MPATERVFFVVYRCTKCDTLWGTEADARKCHKKKESKDA